MNQEDFIKHLTAEIITVQEIVECFRRNSDVYCDMRIDMQRSLDDGSGYTLYCTLWPRVDFILSDQTVCPILRTTKSYYLEIESVFNDPQARNLNDTTYMLTYIYEIL